MAICKTDKTDTPLHMLPIPTIKILGLGISKPLLEALTEQYLTHPRYPETNFAFEIVDCAEVDSEPLAYAVTFQPHLIFVDPRFFSTLSDFHDFFRYLGAKMASGQSKLFVVTESAEEFLSLLLPSSPFPVARYANYGDLVVGDADCFRFSAFASPPMFGIFPQPNFRFLTPPESLPSKRKFFLATTLDFVTWQDEVWLPNDFIAQLCEENQISNRTGEMVGFFYDEKQYYLSPGLPWKKMDELRLEGFAIHYILEFAEIKQEKGGNSEFRRKFGAVVDAIRGEQTIATTAAMPAVIKSTVPITVVGTPEVTGKICVALLQEAGYQRVTWRENLTANALNNSILLRINSQEKEDEPFFVVNLGKSLEKINRILDQSESLERLPFITLDSHQFESTDQVELELRHLRNKRKTLEKEASLVGANELFHEQEASFFQKVQSKLLLLERIARKTPLWDSEDVRCEALKLKSMMLLGFDKNEAEKIFTELSRIPRKIWIDLNEYTDLQQLAGLDVSRIAKFYDFHELILDQKTQTQLLEKIDGLKSELPSPAAREEFRRREIARLEEEILLTEQKIDESIYHFLWIFLKCLIEGNSDRLFRIAQKIAAVNRTSLPDNKKVQDILIASRSEVNCDLLAEVWHSIFPQANKPEKVDAFLVLVEELDPFEENKLREHFSQDQDFFKASERFLAKKNAQRIKEYMDTLIAMFKKATPDLLILDLDLNLLDILLGLWKQEPLSSPQTSILAVLSGELDEKKLKTLLLSDVKTIYGRLPKITNRSCWIEKWQGWYNQG